MVRQERHFTREFKIEPVRRILEDGHAAGSPPGSAETQILARQGCEHRIHHARHARTLPCRADGWGGPDLLCLSTEPRQLSESFPDFWTSTCTPLAALSCPALSSSRIFLPYGQSVSLQLQMPNAILILNQTGATAIVYQGSFAVRTNRGLI